MRFSLAFIFVSLTVSLFAERQPFERYQSIVDRQMFGEPPPGFDPTKPPSEVAKGSGQDEVVLTRDQEQLKSSVHFSVLNVSPEGIVSVGFTDNSDAKSPKHYYLKLEEERDGWKVTAADAAERTMTVVKDGVEVTLSLGDNSAKGGGTTARSGGTAPAAGGGARKPMLGGLGMRRGGLLRGGGSDGTSSLRSRKEMREQQRQAEAAAAAKAKAEEEARREEERQQRAEEDARRAEEREQQRQQLLQIQEEIRKTREEQQRQAQEAAERENAAE